VKPTRRLPIFPLPDGVFFPETLLPLHIFEPRYRAMVADAMSGDRTLGIQRLRTGSEFDGRGRPAVFEIGCAGEIVEHEPLDDGRSNIVLRGLFRYRMRSEEPETAAYRIANVEVLPAEPLPSSSGAVKGRREFRRLLSRVVAQLADSVGRPEARDLPAHLSDEGLVNEAVSRLGLDVDDRYQLLAMDRLEERYAWVLAHIKATQQRLDLLAPYRRAAVDPRWN